MNDVNPVDFKRTALTTSMMDQPPCQTGLRPPTVFAKALGVATNRITAILNKQRGITADTALRLAQFFCSTPDFWMNLQSSHDVKIARAASGKEIEKSVEPKKLLAA